MTTWMVTGAAGMLGRDVVELLDQEDDAKIVALTRAELDITNADAVRAAVTGDRPDVVVNCAAWTAVDDAETNEADALRVNGQAARTLAAACADAGARLIHISTDYVFDGTAKEPYAEDAPTGPRSAYGRTKLAGEQAVLELLPETGYVVRTAWLYGAHGPNFVRTMIRRARDRESVDVVADQRGQPTWSRDVAAQLLALPAVGAPPGIYHATNSGEASWYGLAAEVYRLLGADPGRVDPTTSDRFPRPAPRPAYSVLGHDGWRRAGLPPLRHWRFALHEAFPALK
jgi:dTDP-4-dehydrorhamnose reductase